MRSASTLLPVAALTYLVFVVYGSLVPFRFRARSLQEALDIFANIPFLDIGMYGRADWIANLVLYLPLGYLFAASLARVRALSRHRALIAFFVLTACALLAVGVEFLQLFFEPRTVSLNDLIAEFLGALLGVMLFVLAGRRISRLWVSLYRGGLTAVRAALVFYALVYVGLALFPYDFVGSGAEFAWKLNSGQYGWWVAAGGCGDVWRCVARLSIEAAASAPLGALLLVWRPGNRALMPLTTVLGYGVGLGLLIETAQLFVASGVSQGISVLARGGGVLLGGFAFRHWTPAALGRWAPQIRLAVALFVLPYLVLLARLNGLFGDWLPLPDAWARLGQVHYVPFYYHYYTSEAAAMASLVLHAAMYAPIGIGYWAWHLRVLGTLRAAQGWVPALVAALVAAVAEFGKLFIAAKHPDTTDILIAALAAYAAFVAALWVSHQLTGWYEQAGRARTPAREPQPTAAIPEPAAQEPRVPIERRSIAPLPILAAVLAGVAVIGLVVSYPLGPWWPGVAVIAYGALLMVRPHAWLVALPALLPVLDFAPWTGRFYVDEFDLAILVTLGVGYWRLARTPRRPLQSVFGASAIRGLFFLFAASVLISLLIGVLPFPSLDPNAFANYYSRFNAARLAKGLFWALLLYPLLRQAAIEGRGVHVLFGFGMTLGVALLTLVVLWERLVFVGLFDFATAYRVTGMFSSMHVGGAHIEAYLAIALALLAAPLAGRPTALRYVLAAAVFVAATYAIFVTFSRAGYLAYLIALLALGVAALRVVLRTRRVTTKRVAAAGLALLIAGAVAFPIVTGQFTQTRFGAVKEDLTRRLQHWESVLRMADDDVATTVFGMGLGRYPQTFLWNNEQQVQPATFRIASENGNAFLRLGSGEALYFEQRVAVRPGGDYVLHFDARSADSNASLSIPVCEKALLYSYTCRWLTQPLAQNSDAWQRFELRFNVGALAQGPWYARRPVKLSLYNGRAGTTVDVDNLSLLDADGVELLRNGDFAQGTAHWFFATDYHWAWDIANLWVELLFDQGWFGLLSFSVLAAALLATAWRGGGRGDWHAAVRFGALGGFLAAGAFGSILDAPRLSLLFFALVGLTLVPTGAGRLHPARHAAATQDASPSRAG